MAGAAQNAYEQQVWQQVAGMQQAQQAPAGRTVTPEDERKMLVRRCGNICLDARDRGWLARFEGDSRNFRVVFRHRDGREVIGKAGGTKATALVRAAEQLETLGFLRE